MSDDPDLQSGDIYVGKWPVLRPQLTRTDPPGWRPLLTWTSYEWKSNNLIIESWDPAFDGGNNCGPTEKEECFYIIGVHGWCQYSDLPPFDYTIRVSVTAAANNIFNEPQYNQV